MKASVRSDLSKIGADDYILIFVDEKTRKGLEKGAEKFASGLLASADLSSFTASAGEVFLFAEKGRPSVILCGMGDPEKITEEKMRNFAAAGAGFCRSKKILSLSVLVPEVRTIADESALTSVAEGLMFSNYSFSKYKSDKSKDVLLKKAVFCTKLKSGAAIVRETAVVAENIFFCRDLVNDTTDEVNPLTFSETAAKIAKKCGIKCTVLDKRAIEKKKMGLILAVNRGGGVPSRVVVLEYHGGSGSGKTIGLVGKGITFDSGGMNLKPGSSMAAMRMDMAGAATVLAVIKCAAELKLKKNITAVIPLTENMLSSSAYRPGDIFKSYNGTTVEIGNTDAEGRLILADALSYMEKELKPAVMIDLATLTGACVVTFGETVAAYMTEDEKTAALLEEASAGTGERLWRLPFFDDYDDRMKSEIADLSNMSSEKNAGTISAAVFLRNFVTKTPWAHIDIAGTAWYSKARGYRPKNATGYGVRLVLEFIRKWK